MKNKNLELGKRYQLPPGPGTLIGHERFYGDGIKSRIVKIVNPNKSVRHVFKLDDGINYKWFINNRYYYACSKYIQRIKNE